ncbi:AFG1 family ATPase [Schizosaccharomyces japonicus yFS275]|uniref:AFG1 family ATPase n=1 Tax=Schizosaccharomyces japonicus (strain yFS275 / FY16936) TaxID=402676 RepID=B6K625_SCHJY|nr:AFG1 family ATPase [Schizosaccharomyces japonicus yFS275]EEB08979.2 AFG1 family ATPase [Schizosaccharomyces japonicus yFS275]
MVMLSSSKFVFNPNVFFRLRSCVWQQFRCVTSMKNDFMNVYDTIVREKRLQEDSKQRDAVRILDDVFHQLAAYQQPSVVADENAKSGSQSAITGWRDRRLFGKHFVWLGRFLRRSPSSAIKTPKGVYMYGNAGSGKTMLMDLFYAYLPPNIQRKRRTHFHSFMVNMHQESHAIWSAKGGTVDIPCVLARHIASECTVLCLDELQVTDVADALLLRRLFELLTSYGVVLFFTSNRAPDDLYINGLQRESFLPCIELLKRQLHVIHLDSPYDHRRSLEHNKESVFINQSTNKNADATIAKWFKRLSGCDLEQAKPETLEVFGRTVLVPKAHKNVAVFPFEELCGKPKSASDYLVIVQRFTTIIVVNIPRIPLERNDLVRRFINFIDVAYEQRTKLILSSQVPIQNIYPTPSETQPMFSPSAKFKESHYHGSFQGIEEVFAFERCQSRLIEMESSDWGVR